MALAWALFLCWVHLGWVRARGPLSPMEKALWLQAASKRVLASLGIRYRLTGEPPKRGVVVANHLSYLDILIFSAAMPCVFVSKAEVSNWPYFGMAARAGGTLFLDRSSRASASAVAEAMMKKLENPVPVLFFPEGTSTDGSQVQPFHRFLFEPAVKAGATITSAAVRYVIDAGIPERELCWFGDDGFLPHLWKTLGTPGFSAEVTFGEPQVFQDRRAAAEGTHAQVTAMRGVPKSVAESCISA